jgi:hypothetical protein
MPCLRKQASCDRLILNAEEHHLWKQVAQQPAAGTLEVAIPRQEDRPLRTATLTIRFMPVTLKVPYREADCMALPELTAWAIWVCEETPPTDGQPIQWKLLTNLPTDDFAQAGVRIQWYSCRWVVEMFHRS